MKKIRLFSSSCILILLLTISQYSKAQDSSHLRISLLTCSPGDELYSIFGHSALRITDSTSVEDIVFNFGTFNFNEEGFYVKFLRGKLLYYLSTERFNDFVDTYFPDNRGIREQVLDLSSAEKLEIRRALLENLQEDNKFYLYDFFLDNCTTRLRDLILAKKHPTPLLPAVMPINTTFREAIHFYLDKGNKYWSKLGIDLLLGARTDAIMTVSQQQFLPDNLMIALDSSRNTTIVKSAAELYEIKPEKKSWNLFTPMTLFTSLLLIVLVAGMSNNKKILPALIIFDSLFFFMVGVLGIIMIVMWLGTDHRMTKNNYNLIWALPTHAIIAFMVWKENIFLKKYILISIILQCLLLLAWFFLPQEMNNALLPVVLLLLYRSVSKYLTLKSLP